MDMCIFIYIYIERECNHEFPKGGRARPRRAQQHNIIQQCNIVYNIRSYTIIQHTIYIYIYTYNNIVYTIRLHHII